MATMIHTKKRFMEWLDKQIDEDEIVIFSMDFEGSISYKAKRNVKTVAFGFAADAFKRKDDIGHFAFGKTPVFALCVCKKEDASEDTIKLYDSLTANAEARGGN